MTIKIKFNTIKLVSHYCGNSKKMAPARHCSLQYRADDAEPKASSKGKMG